MPPHFFGLAQRNGSGAPKKNALVQNRSVFCVFLRVFRRQKWSSRRVNEFSASPSVHCFAYARGTANHNPASGASEAKPTAAGGVQSYPMTG